MFLLYLIIGFCLVAALLYFCPDKFCELDATTLTFLTLGFILAWPGVIAFTLIQAFFKHYLNDKKKVKKPKT